MKETPPYIPDYIPQGHQYARPGDGLPLDSVTTITRHELGICMRGSLIWANFGTEVHKACQWHDEGTLKKRKVDKLVIPYVEQYKIALEKEKIKVLANEVMRYDPEYLFAGRIDKLVKIGGDFGILDIKTGEEIDWHRWQTAAYKRLISHEVSGPIKRFCLYLWSSAYYPKEFTGKNDLQEFMVLNAAYKVKANAGYYRRGDGN